MRLLDSPDFRAWRQASFKGAARRANLKFFHQTLGPALRTVRTDFIAVCDAKSAKIHAG